MFDDRREVQLAPEYFSTKGDSSDVVSDEEAEDNKIRSQIQCGRTEDVEFVLRLVPAEPHHYHFDRIESIGA